MSAISDTTTPDLKVDENPISPIERRNSLEKHLQHRPDAQDLKNRNILLDTNAAPYDTGCAVYNNMTDMYSSLQAAQLELERQRNTDNLRKGLEHRPEREELERRVYTILCRHSSIADQVRQHSP